MNRVHFDDLTKINVPFALLDDDTKRRLRRASNSGATIQIIHHDPEGWYGIKKPTMLGGYTYRVSPDEKLNQIPPSVPWYLFKPEWRFHARDADGRAFMYTEKPLRYEHTWFSSGGLSRVDALHNYIPGTVDWKDSLLERPRSV